MFGANRDRLFAEGAASDCLERVKGMSKWRQMSEAGSCNVDASLIVARDSYKSFLGKEQCR